MNDLLSYQLSYPKGMHGHLKSTHNHNEVSCNADDPCTSSFCDGLSKDVKITSTLCISTK